MYYAKKIKSWQFLSAIILLALISIIGITLPLDPTTAKADSSEVYLGGTPIGLHLKASGLITQDFKPIITEKGTLYPARDGGIIIGDFITQANGNATLTPQDLQAEIDKNPCVTLTILRNNEKIELTLNAVYDPIANKNKLGLIVKNDISGIGTLTYVDNNGNYCSLGHKICDPPFDNCEKYQSGKVYPATILGIYKGKENEAGALKGAFDKSKQAVGNVSKNNAFGVYGKLEDKSFYNNWERVKIGSKNDVKPGKAYIYSTLDDNKVEKYQIEIIKTYDQKSPEIKGMVIRVTDKRLQEKCGGIVQGMSGSPIVQDGKLVGAVTHVFLNDAQIGYGVYIDWLL